MTSNSSVVPATRAADALGVFGVGGSAPTEPQATLSQRIGPAVTDHRGRIEIPAYAVLVDTVGGGPFVVRTGPEYGVVQARLAFATSGGPVPAAELLTAVATLRDTHEGFGLTTVDVTGEGGGLYASVLVRNARTGRVFDETLLARGSDDTVAGADGVAHRAIPDTLGSVRDLPPRIDPALAGAQIVDAIIGERLTAGAIADRLGLSVRAGERGPSIVCTPEDWMANALGTMHGGVIAAIVGQACSLAGQAHTAPGQTYAITDFAINFFRSPPVDAGDLTVTTQPERVGRRLGSVSAVFTQSDGTLLARATADVTFG